MLRAIEDPTFQPSYVSKMGGERRNVLADVGLNAKPAKANDQLFGLLRARRKTWAKWFDLIRTSNQPPAADFQAAMASPLGGENDDVRFKLAPRHAQIIDIFRSSPS